jgi:hypothetical protein
MAGIQEQGVVINQGGRIRRELGLNDGVLCRACKGSQRNQEQNKQTTVSFHALGIE